MQHRFV